MSAESKKEFSVPTAAIAATGKRWKARSNNQSFGKYRMLRENFDGIQAIARFPPD